MANNLLKFSTSINPFDTNKTCFHEHREGLKPKLIFMVDKASFETDEEHKNTIDFILNSLNKNI